MSAWFSVPPHDNGGGATDDTELSVPVWAVFGDLMAGLVGAFVLLLMAVAMAQVEMADTLRQEVKRREQEELRRTALESALAGPLASGRVTLDNGRIGISGSVLFDLNSDQLKPEGERLLKTLVHPLQVYLSERDELLMVSGFTDDTVVQVRPGQRFVDNLELSAQRALTVTRSLIAQGMPQDRVFGAAFGDSHPVASNATEGGRALNRRVEMAPVPRARSLAGAPSGSDAASRDEK
jgi:flagellar motor protein MotB